MKDPLIRTAFGLHRSGRLADASRLYGEVLASDPHDTEALFLLGSLNFQRGEFTAALAQFDRLLAIKPDFAEGLAARGTALSRLNRHAEALAAYDLALAARPGNAEALNNRGNALLSLQRYADAVATYDRALALKPQYPEAWRNRGIALMQLSRPADAIASFDKALALRPDFADAWEARGTALMGLRRHAEAIAAYDKVLAWKPATPDLLYHRGNAHANQKNYQDAIRDCEKLLAMEPDYPYARGVLVHAKLQSCDWDGLDAERAKITTALKHGKRTVSPFNLKALSDSAKEQLRCAELWVTHECPPLPTLSGRRPYRHDRIRLAYISGDFNNTAVGTLMANTFEHHDRERFETIAISFGPIERTPMRVKLEAAFERFIEVSRKTDSEIAAMIRDMQIDIAVDLMGFTGDCRSAIFAHHAAPLQVNYLGFAGSMGAPFMDYIIADPTVIPEEHRRYYAESVAYLPNCYLPANPAPPIAKRPSRVEAGLPERGFVFASFNNSYKFSAPMFEIWMRLLRAIPESVLWLPQNNPAAMRNLLREAEARGVAAGRMIFAPPIPAVDQYLARLSLADLFLDTLPYNAHSTAIDALSAGVPVLTLLGNSFAGRVAASALKAVNLPKLIAETPAAYERLALELARNPAALAALREKLAGNRTGSPLFDSEGFTRSLEAALQTMWERHERGEPPASFGASQ